MATSLSAGYLKNLDKFPYLLPDSVNIASLASSSITLTTLFDYSGLKSSGLLVRPRYVQASNATGVKLEFVADDFRPKLTYSSALAEFNPFEDAFGETWNAPAGDFVQLLAQQNTGAAIDNFWANWSLEAFRPNVAQRLQLPGSLRAPTAAEEQLGQKAGLGGPQPRGVLPRTLDWIIDNEYRTQIVAIDLLTQVTDVDTGAPTLIGQANAKGNEALVLAGLYTSQGSGTDGLSMLIGIDEDDGFLTVTAYGAGGGKPMRTFIQAASQIKIQASATATSDSVTMAAVVWHVRLTEEIKARLGDEAAQNTPAAEKIASGVL